MSLMDKYPETSKLLKQHVLETVGKRVRNAEDKDQWNDIANFHITKGIEFVHQMETTMKMIAVRRTVEEVGNAYYIGELYGIPKHVVYALLSERFVHNAEVLELITFCNPYDLNSHPALHLPH